MRRTLLFICLLFTTIVGTQAQQVEVQSSLDTNTIWVGDQINYTITINKSRSTNLSLPVISEKLGDNIEILETSFDTTNDGANQIITQQYLVTAFDSGLFYIPPYPVVIQTDNRSDTINTSKTYLEVLPFYIQDLEGKEADIKEIEPVPITFRETVPYLLGLIILALLILGYLYYRRKQAAKKGKPIRKAPPEPAYVIAERELDQLKNEKLWQQNKLKEYYSRLTFIIRKYVEHQFGIKAMEQTSSEILQSVRDYGLFDAQTREILAEMLPLADMVKFAKGTANPDDNVKHLENAYQFIRLTKVFIADKSEEDNSGTTSNSNNNKQ